MSHAQAPAQAGDWFDEDERKERPWKPAVGDKLLGTVTDIDVRTVSWKEQQRSVVVLLIDTGDPEYIDTVWCLHTVLANEVRKLAPQTGDTVGVMRLADSEQGYKRYRVQSPDAKQRGFDWRNAPTDQGDIAPEHRKQFYDSPPAPPRESPDADPFGDDEPMPWESK